MAFNRKYFNLFKYLFPKANTFWLFIQKKLTQLIEGLTALPDNFRTYIDEIYFDIFPDTTRSLELWEIQFGIQSPSLDEIDRRETINQRWKLKGGQGPDYIEQTLNDADFAVQVHENNPPVDPANFLVGDFVMVAGGDNAYAGRDDAYAGKTTVGELLVNGFISVTTDQRLYLMNAGNGYAGNSKAVAGYFEQFLVENKTYELPTDPDEWPFIWFIGGDAVRNVNNELVSIEVVQIPAEREQEFKDLILLIKPTHTWVGLIVEFVY
jgi:hypothetical protein